MTEWRDPPQAHIGDKYWNPRLFWDQLNLGPIFLARGYELWPPQKWVSENRDPVEPKEGWPIRVFDGFAYRSPYNTDDRKGEFNSIMTVGTYQ